MDDCYFFYYSQCSKGDTCAYRHEPAARGTEVVCEAWEYGRCQNAHCVKRHMHIKVNRSETPCYWETQPGGCQKPHCVFKHLKVKQNAVTVASKSLERVLNEDVPSPKISPVLINSIDDTDDDSPVKAARLKPAVNNGTINSRKKISLKGVNTTEDVPPENPKTTGIKNDAIADVEQKPDQTSSTEEANIKSARQLKRERILKARLEYERKRFAMSNNQDYDDSARVVVCKDQAITITSSNNSTAKLSISPVQSVEASCRVPLPPKCNGTPNVLEARSLLENSVHEGTMESTAQDPAEIKIKTFDEIMEEKRKRKLQQQSSNVTPVVIETVSLLDESVTEDKKTASATQEPVDIKIKTFDEIMKEKRKRKLQEQSNAGVASSTAKIAHRSKPPAPALSTMMKRPKLLQRSDEQNGQVQTTSTPAIIPLRKMKIRSSQASVPAAETSKKRITLKRTSFNTISTPARDTTDGQRHDEVVPPSHVKVSRHTSKEIINDTDSLDSSQSSRGQTPDRSGTNENADPQEEEECERSPKIFEEAVENGTQSDDGSAPLDIDEELDLLSDSGYLQTAANSSPAAIGLKIDDDELMDEMDKLLA